MQEIHMETAQSNSLLSGSDEHWGNTKCGMVFTKLVEGDYANPVFFLDEIDKAFEGEHDPLASLYSLMEQATAISFTDASYPWLPGLDASRIVWICTCNDVNAIPEPILDRLRVFDIALPTQKQGRQIVEGLMARLIERLPQQLKNIRLTKGAIDALVQLSPRQAQSALLEAFGTAVYRNKKHVTLADVPEIILKEQKSHRMGFL